MANETSTLKVGDEAPDFELRSSPTGDKWKLSEHRGKNVVLNFVPAAFSPVCSQQLPVIQEESGKANAEMVVISCDNPWSQSAWKESSGVGYTLLSDFWPHGDTSSKYGVFLDGFGVATRAVVVVDAQGKVAYIDVTEPRVIPDYGPVLECVNH